MVSASFLWVLIFNESHITHYCHVYLLLDLMECLIRRGLGFYCFNPEVYIQKLCTTFLRNSNSNTNSFRNIFLYIYKPFCNESFSNMDSFTLNYFHLCKKEGTDNHLTWYWRSGYEESGFPWSVQSTSMGAGPQIFQNLSRCFRNDLSIISSSKSQSIFLPISPTETP